MTLALPPEELSSSLDWNELRPRLALIEERVAGLRVLEVGTRDLRSVLHLVDAGASRVTGRSTSSPARQPCSAK